MHRQTIEAEQLEKLNRLLVFLKNHNPFYRRKFHESELQLPLRSLEDFSRQMPFTTKQELIDDQIAHPPYGSNLSDPMECYVRFHQTSGTTAQPLVWLDTTESWGWVVNNWAQVYRAVNVKARDTVFFAFSFGPFLGFWSAMDAAQKIGCLCITGGGMSSAARLQCLLDNRATVLCCTPTYALRLAATALEENISLERSAVRALIVAGEPGGSLPAVRRQIESAWPGARVFDHHGMTEVGPVSFESFGHPGVLHVIESSYLAEAIHPETGQSISEGEQGELVLTTLGRSASPLLRYRTGDFVRPSWKGESEFGRSELALVGGILGRVDDMVLVRGVNVYPSVIEETVRACGGVAEYQVRIEEKNALTEMTLVIETLPGTEAEDVARQIEGVLRNRLQLRVPVRVAEPGTLPRFEMKAKRWIRKTS